MGATPDQLKERIDHTRQELSSDVDTLADRVLPSRVAQRKVTSMRIAMTTVRERVMGTAEQASSATTGTVQAAAGSVSSTVGTAAGSAAGAVGAAAGSVAQTAQELPDLAMTRTQGNPLAAGLLAFGAGMVVASLLPETKAEQQAGTALKEHASELTTPLAEAAKESAQSVKEAVAPVAREATEDLKQSVAEAVETTTQQAQSATSEVGQEAMTAAERARHEVRP